jgi:hypothetical protein
MIFVYVWTTWGIVELKTRFETWITSNDANGVCLFHLSYLITFMDFYAHKGHKTSKPSIICLIGWSTDGFSAK